MDEGLAYVTVMLAGELVGQWDGRLKKSPLTHSGFKFSPGFTVSEAPMPSHALCPQSLEGAHLRLYLESRYLLSDN